MSAQAIYAGDTEQAKQLVKDLGYTGRVIIIHDTEDLAPLRRGSTVWIVGTYYRRKDFDEIAEACSARDISFVDPCASLKGVR